MKSVGEVMAIGRTFPEVIQKALRMLDIGVQRPRPGRVRVRRPRARAALRRRRGASSRSRRRWRDGMTRRRGPRSSRASIRWFLQRDRSRSSRMHARLAQRRGMPLAAALLRDAKRLGFSDLAIDAQLTAPRGHDARGRAQAHGIAPALAQIDTTGRRVSRRDQLPLLDLPRDGSPTSPPSRRRRSLMLGSGAYRIGSSVEFDWCVRERRAGGARRSATRRIMVNYNPETVSTDYDICDRLVFDEISLETVLDLYEREKPDGRGRQHGRPDPEQPRAAARRSRACRSSAPAPSSIDRAEDRAKFSALLDELGIDQPQLARTSPTLDRGRRRSCEQLGGFPVLVRPSYVLSGAAMSVAHEPNELQTHPGSAPSASRRSTRWSSRSSRPHAREIEIDAVADHGEHRAVGDQRAHRGRRRAQRRRHAGAAAADALHRDHPPHARRSPRRWRARCEITGPFNVQFLAKNNAGQGHRVQPARVAQLPVRLQGHSATTSPRKPMRRMLGVAQRGRRTAASISTTSASRCRCSRSRGCTAPIRCSGVEMASTGEVGCLGGDRARGAAARAARDRLPLAEPRRAALARPGGRQVLVRRRGARRSRDELEAADLRHAGHRRDARASSASSAPPSARTPATTAARCDIIEQGAVDLVINVPREYDQYGRPDGYLDPPPRHRSRRAADHRPAARARARRGAARTRSGPAGSAGVERLRRGRARDRAHCRVRSWRARSTNCCCTAQPSRCCLPRAAAVRLAALRRAREHARIESGGDTDPLPATGRCASCA